MNESSVSRRRFVTTSAIVLAGVATGQAAAGDKKTWTATEKANAKVVSDFLRAWEQKDAEAIGTLVTPESRSRTAAHTAQAPMNPEILKRSATGFFSMGSVKFTILDTIAQGPMIINTRIDRVTLPNGVQDLHYMGVFFLKDGKIQEWSDYEVAPATPVKA